MPRELARQRTARCRSRLAPPGISLVEVTLSIAIVGGLLASVFTAVGVSAKRGFSTTQRSKATWLAHDLLAEIGAKPCYADVGNVLTLTPIDLSDLSGLKAEQGPSRAAFDSVYDYANWSSTPPVDTAGEPLPGYTGWTRVVTVVPINPSTLTPRTVDDGAALVTVLAIGPHGQRQTTSAIRSSTADELRGIDHDSDTGVTISVGGLITLKLGG